jgi:hypothetical protein
MSMFGTIMSKIFGHASATPAAADATPADATAAPAPVSTDTTVQQPAAAAPATQSVDVGAVLAAMAAQNGQKLNYQTSIVDLLKLLDLDSSLEARKTLAGELHYTGSTDDSATMNVWLHKAVMTKLEENGGKVPAELKGS